MVQVSENFEQLVDLDPVLAEIFYQAYEKVPETRQLLYGGRGSSKAKETDLRVGGFSDPTEFKGTVEYDTADPDYEVEYRHTEFAKGFLVERKMLDDMQYENIFQAAADLAVAFARKQEKDAWATFNNAFSSSYLGYDGKALCANDHPRSKTDSTSVDNLAALELNSANLETAVVQLMGLQDDIGEEITIVPNVLIVPRALRQVALELTGSQLTPESANNAINVHSDMQALVSPYLTDSNAWFVADSVMSKRYLKWYNRVPVEFAATDDFDTLIRKYRGYMRYSRGWSDFRWVVGSNPS